MQCSHGHEEASCLRCGHDRYDDTCWYCAGVLRKAGVKLGRGNVHKRCKAKAEKYLSDTN
jgi:hypothetical protein